MGVLSPTTKVSSPNRPATKGHQQLVKGQARSVSRQQTSKFLFVNKDATSLSLSNSTSNRQATLEIRRHAQTQGKGDDGRPVKARPFVVAKSRVIGWAAIPSQQLTKIGHTEQQEGVGKDIRHQIERGQKSYVAQLLPAIDATGATWQLDYDKKLVLTYFTQVRQIWKAPLPEGGHINSFTPVRTEDREYAPHVLASALQSQNELALYSLLAVTARRLRLLTETSFADDRTPEIYTVRAIQALRKQIDEGWGSTSRNDHSLLWIAYLTLAEFYVKDASRTSTYFDIMKSLIISRGGFGKVHPYDLQFALAVDLMISCNTLSQPELDALRWPLLAGISTSSYDVVETIEQRVIHALSGLDDRIRFMYSHTLALRGTMQTVHSLPTQAVASLSIFTKRRMHLFPIQALSLWLAKSKSETYAHLEVISSVDAIYFQLRLLSFQAWLLATAFGFLNREQILLASLQEPAALQYFSKHTNWFMDNLEGSLSGTEWLTHNLMTLWILALACLISRSYGGDHVRYEQRFVEAARVAKIASRVELGEALGKGLPLDRIDSQWREKLWSLIDISMLIDSTLFFDLD